MPIPKPQIIQFHVGVGAGKYLTAAQAYTAAEAHRALMEANGNTWAVHGWPGAGPVYHQPAEDPQSVGIYINRFQPTLLDPPGGPLPDPVGTERVNFVSSEWILE